MNSPTNDNYKNRINYLKEKHNYVKAPENIREKTEAQGKFILEKLQRVEVKIVSLWLSGYDGVLGCSVTSNSLWPHGLYPAGPLCPWILQARILEQVAIPVPRRFSLTQGLNRYLLSFLHWQVDSFVTIVT